MVGGGGGVVVWLLAHCSHYNTFHRQRKFEFHLSTGAVWHVREYQNHHASRETLDLAR